MVRLSLILREPQKLKQALSAVATSNWWKDVPLGPPDVILGIYEAHKRDPNPNKVDLTVGAYRCENGRPYVLKSVLKAEQNIVDKKLPKENESEWNGSKYFRECTFRLAVGENLSSLDHVMSQSVSGSGSLRVAAETLGQIYNGKKLIYISNPSWVYHAPIFEQSGIQAKYYRYYDNKNHEIDHSGLMTDLMHMEDNSIVLFQLVGHNPCATDPSQEQWHEMSDILKRKNILIFFDMAYQGFSSGDMDKDAYGLRHFLKQEKHRVVFAQSYSKSMGIYSVRVGAATFIVGNKDDHRIINEQLKNNTLCLCGTPPIHGSQIVEEIFSNPPLKSEWKKEIAMMVDRIKEMRELLFRKLQENGSSRDWTHLIKQKGMFFYSGLSYDQCEELINNHSIYVVKNGRIAVPGINHFNVDSIAEKLHNVTK